ncbi:lysine transporter LysE [Solibacillus sp. R5-41]|uniref:LysE family translocator n=1 Tax=Solibacillus sp. R5-41 TaxID=2048654 RepID=UPI000C129483|nr:LysE family translocator [Solibacillus sp. R5-41]ATP40153.1 lysine transporter LysE [Solibacillus sp. R5-41]
MVNMSLFIITCVLLIILPGPDTAIVTKNTVVGGRTAGMQTLIGSCIGLVIHTVAAVAGLSAIIVQSAVAFSVIKYVGAAYLCYLGIRTLMNMRTKKNQVDEETVVVANGSSFFKQGFITNVTNPKVAVFFLTFLPQFLAPGSEPFWSFLLMGIIYTVLTLLWFIFYVFLLGIIRNFMKRPVTQSVIEVLTGSVLIGFGMKLALEKSNG